VASRLWPWKCFSILPLALRMRSVTWWRQRWELDSGKRRTGIATHACYISQFFAYRVVHSNHNMLCGIHFKIIPVLSCQVGRCNRTVIKRPSALLSVWPSGHRKLVMTLHVMSRKLQTQLHAQECSSVKPHRRAVSCLGDGVISREAQWCHRKIAIASGFARALEHTRFMQCILCLQYIHSYWWICLRA
jgi:hypothetical protein